MIPEEKKIEEAARLYAEEKGPLLTGALKNMLAEVFSDGAKWMQKGMYSEADLKEAYKAGESHEYAILTGRSTKGLLFHDWFEQNKKKP